MKTSLIWTAAGIAAVGFGVPAYAAMSAPSPKLVPPAVVRTSDDNTTSTSMAPITSVTVDDHGVDATVTSVDDHGVDATENSVDDNGVDATENSVDDHGVDATENSVEDVRGNCDEAEHANDPACGGAGTVTSVDDNGADDNGVDATVTSVDDNGVNRGGNGGGADDSGHGRDDG